jgi:multisubunit Na+/H+ antiporter MnhG subunit
VLLRSPWPGLVLLPLCLVFLFLHLLLLAFFLVLLATFVSHRLLLAGHYGSWPERAICAKRDIVAPDAGGIAEMSVRLL